MSRAISAGYVEAASWTRPPPPKQPQSIDSPRAHAEAMPMMKARNNPADTAAIPRVSRPSTRHAPTTTSTTGSRCPTVGTTASGSSS